MDQQAEAGASEQRKSTLNSNGRCLKIIDRFRYEKKIASVLSNSIYVFKLDTNYSGYSQILYDADANKFEIQLSTTPLSLYAFEDQRASIIVKIDRSDSYIGSNAFGATRLVNRYEGTQYGIALVNQNDFGSQSSYSDGYRTINIEIAMPLDKAKQLKDDIGILLLCMPSMHRSKAKMKYRGNDLIFEKYYYPGATIDSSTSHYYDQNFLNVKVLAIWVYDFRTGEVILKKELIEPEAIENTESTYAPPDHASSKKEAIYFLEDNFWKDADEVYETFSTINQQFEKDINRLEFKNNLSIPIAAAYNIFTTAYANSGYCPTDEKGFAELIDETRQMQKEIGGQSDERVFCHGLKVVNAIYKFAYSVMDDRWKMSLRLAQPQPNEVLHVKQTITQYAEMTSKVLQGMKLILQNHR